jgi:hypothetical protein
MSKGLRQQRRGDDAGDAGDVGDDAGRRRPQGEPAHCNWDSHFVDQDIR